MTLTTNPKGAALSAFRARARLGLAASIRRRACFKPESSTGLLSRKSFSSAEMLRMAGIGLGGRGGGGLGVGEIDDDGGLVALEGGGDDYKDEKDRKDIDE